MDEDLKTETKVQNGYRDGWTEIIDSSIGGTERDRSEIEAEEKDSVGNLLTEANLALIEDSIGTEIGLDRSGKNCASAGETQLIAGAAVVDKENELDEASSVLSKLTSQEEEFELSELYVSSDAETEKMEYEQGDLGAVRISALAKQEGGEDEIESKVKTEENEIKSGADDGAVGTTVIASEGGEGVDGDGDDDDDDEAQGPSGRSASKKRHIDDDEEEEEEEEDYDEAEVEEADDDMDSGNDIKRGSKVSNDSEESATEDLKFKKPKLPASAANYTHNSLSSSTDTISSNLVGGTAGQSGGQDEDEPQDNEGEDEDEDEELDLDDETNKVNRNLKTDGESTGVASTVDAAVDDESFPMEKEKLRQDALHDIIEIEYEFAELRQKLYENELAKLQTELQMCLEGSHPALQTYYQKIDSIRDFKLMRAYQRQKYELECIDKETAASRTFIHQNFYRQLSELQHKLLNETTQKWYDINKERRAMDVLVSEVSYHVPVKIANKTLSCITGYAAPSQPRREGDKLPEDLECEGINFRFKNNPVDKLEVIVDRMRFNNQLSDLEGLKRFFGAFPGAPMLSGLKDSEIYDDIQTLQK